jgi:hypothetical protein
MLPRPKPSYWANPLPQYQQTHAVACQEYCRRDSHFSEASRDSRDEAFGQTQVAPLQSISRHPTTEVNYREIVRANTTITEADCREEQGNNAEEAPAFRKRKLNALCAQRYHRDST